MPDYVILDPELLKTLPMYQKKCTFLDALCQAIESWWSVQSTEESREYAKKAIGLLMKDMDAYLDEENEPGAHTLANILEGANRAGMAINFTQTTAPHAMCYKLTSLYGLPHGHAVAICLPVVWRFMFENIKTCENPRGLAHVEKVMEDISREIGFDTVEAAIAGMADLLDRLDIKPPSGATDKQFAALVASVNPDRLKNSPIPIDAAAVSALYKAVLGM
jgi:alcohol dehydrogenase class IV